jgi:hypothetical protein
MKIKTFEVTTKMNCETALDKCSDKIIEKLKPLGLKLIADHPNDTVNGSVTILHDVEHIIRIEIYTESEGPNKDHLATLEKPLTIPNEHQIKSLLA